MKPIPSDSPLGVALLALRAGGMSAEQVQERWPTRNHGFFKAVRLGLAERVGDEYRLTEAGRAACPLRNPLAAAGAVQPPVTTETDMARDNILTRQQVLAAIKSAGPAGITKAQLTAQFNDIVDEPAVTSHLVVLKKSGEALNPSRGLWVAATFGGAAEVERIEIADVHPTTAANFEALGPGDDAEAPATSSAEPKQEVRIELVTPFSVVIDAADDIEIGLFSDGSLRIVAEGAVISLAMPATRKLRDFLGLFQGGA